MVIIFIMLAKIATSGLLKIKLFWNTGYDVTVSVPNVTNKILSRDSNYIVDVIMWSKFGNYSISMREVITVSIFIRIWEVVLVQFQQFETSTRYELEIWNKCGKRVKNKSQKVLGPNSYVCRSYRGKTGRGALCHPE